MKALVFSILLLSSVGCATDRQQTPAPSAATTPTTIVVDPSSSPITAAAQREVIRRQERMRRADEAALRASRQMSDGDYESALSSSRQALGGQ